MVSKEVDIYCKDGKCPICERQMIKDYLYAKCPSSCYAIFKGDTLTSISVFRWVFDYDKKRNEYKPISENQENEIIEKISYWKENSRYLMELMTRK